ncbi:MAG: alanyl-tRNA editing protein [Paracoccaceae bacterium]|jgi:misacylated tRNA(Ala) deacylase|nr:MAG: Ala-tRNA(Pro) hydrolase [Rhodobacter sp. BACL10 MAG-120419-bin15]MDP5351114.1 alanyl-tRNA editing protein [Paracoccaceae bacterium]HCB52471.1 Ala-tRNA(Pro) hydrolase [Rhodobacter sp.]MDP5355858.1 alanyl-tRNA editing protein [Paracoccaceae bacterium]MDP5368214.1 alanyl-tRNA editing protein [Paracoccaceae bacterium]|tara:strand:- start:139 stop:858 length:720 start_codon:yes stop_codon:yes gene_type:complete
MTILLYQEDPYLSQAPSIVAGYTSEGGIILHQSIFYPTGGGQPGDSGTLSWEGRKCEIAAAIKAGEGQIALIASDTASLPPIGALVIQSLDWERRHRHMRMHTALHLLSVVMPFPVTGGQIGAQKGRLDFKLEAAPQDLAALDRALNDLIDQDFEVTESWITESELSAKPQLVKTMSVKPPMGQGRIRLIRIGSQADLIDLQPCGGTHVARTSEVGRVSLGKIENKGAQNRRVHVHFEN